MRGLERYEGAPVEAMRAATRQAVENLVTLCLEQSAQLLLLAGDLFDGDWKDYATGLFFSHQMSRLRQGNVQVVWLRGNHDAASQIRKHLELPSNVRELSTSEPETVVFDELGVAVHGQGFGERVVTDDLAAGYPSPVAGAVNFGLLHTSVTGREGHANYAPCSLDTLLAKEYDYWALGHVHAREVLHERPWVVFPGNLQGRHIREEGAKGATLITLDDGVITAVEHCVLDVARWARCVVPADNIASGYDLVDCVRAAIERQVTLAGGRPLAVRVEVCGRTAAHDGLIHEAERWRSTIRATAVDVGQVWIDKVRFATEPTRDAAAVDRDDAMFYVAQRLDGQRQAGDVEQLVEELGPFFKKLPDRVRENSDGRRLDDVGYMADLLAEAEQLLLARLNAKGRSE